MQCFSMTYIFFGTCFVDDDDADDDGLIEVVFLYEGN